MGLAFNKGKCAALIFNADQHVHFADGTRVPEVEEVTYLGSILSKTHNIRKEAASRTSVAMVVWKRLDIFWKKSHCPAKFKLIVYDAVIRSKLVYGLDCVHIPKHVMSKLNTFQLKGLRKILGMKTTFVARANTNKKVFEEANRVRFADGSGPKIKSFAQYIHTKQSNILGHIVRAPPGDPMRVSSFKENTNLPCTFSNRRVGRPRHHLLMSTYSRVWSDLPQNMHRQFKTDMPQHIDEIANMAINRRPPFESKTVRRQPVQT